MIISKTLLVSASNMGTINGKKTTSIAGDIDKAVNALGVDVKSVSMSSAGSAFSDLIIVNVLYEDQDAKVKSKKS